MAFPHGGPRGGVPDKLNKTLFLEDNQRLVEELRKPDYDSFLD
jgi:hypothetical protein